MPKSSNQKLKLLYIADFLMRETDEENSVFIKDIQEHLQSKGITAESFASAKKKRFPLLNSSMTSSIFALVMNSLRRCQTFVTSMVSICLKVRRPILM